MLLFIDITRTSCGMTKMLFIFSTNRMYDDKNQLVTSITKKTR
jgi:hypothetical protein